VPEEPDAGEVVLHARGYEAVALDHPLSFPPPLASHSPSPEAFQFWWHMLQYVFELPDPATFPAIPVQPTAAEARAMDRYCDAATDLAESALLSGAAEFRLSVRRHADGTFSEKIQSKFASKEITRGFATLFRQFYSTEESAGFQEMQRILRRLNDEARDGAHDTRVNYLSTWGKAQGRLRRFPLKDCVESRAMGHSTMDQTPSEYPDVPERLIKLYNYGEYIHWAEGAETLSEWNADPFRAAHQQMRFLESIGGLAHLYMGFSLLVLAARGAR